MKKENLKEDHSRYEPKLKLYLTALLANSLSGINCRVNRADNFASKSLCTGRPSE